MYHHSLSFALERDLLAARRVLAYEGIRETTDHFEQDTGVFVLSWQTERPLLSWQCQMLLRDTHAIASGFNCPVARGQDDQDDQQHDIHAGELPF